MGGIFSTNTKQSKRETKQKLNDHLSQEKLSNSSTALQQRKLNEIDEEPRPKNEPNTNLRPAPPAPKQGTDREYVNTDAVIGCLKEAEALLDKTDLSRCTDDEKYRVREMLKQLHKRIPPSHKQPSTTSQQETARNVDDQNDPKEKKPKTAENVRIINMEIYFKDDVRAVAGKEGMELIEEMRKLARSYEERVDKHSGPKHEMEYFVLDESLMRLVDMLDKVKCDQDKVMLQEKVRVIKYIKELQERLDLRAGDKSKVSTQTEDCPETPKAADESETKETTSVDERTTPNDILASTPKEECSETPKAADESEAKAKNPAQKEFSETPKAADESEPKAKEQVGECAISNENPKPTDKSEAKENTSVDERTTSNDILPSPQKECLETPPHASESEAKPAIPMS